MGWIAKIQSVQYYLYHLKWNQNVVSFKLGNLKLLALYMSCHISYFIIIFSRFKPGVYH